MWVIALLGLLGLAGCGPEALAPTSTEPNGVEVRLIARVEGCRVYRLLNAGAPVFTTICGAESVTTSTTRTVSCGKNCTRQEPMMVVTSTPTPEAPDDY